MDSSITLEITNYLLITTYHLCLTKLYHKETNIRCIPCTLIVLKITAQLICRIKYNSLHLIQITKIIMNLNTIKSPVPKNPH